MRVQAQIELYTKRVREKERGDDEKEGEKKHKSSLTKSDVTDSVMTNVDRMDYIVCSIFIAGAVQAVVYLCRFFFSSFHSYTRSMFFGQFSCAGPPINNGAQVNNYCVHWKSYDPNLWNERTNNRLSV